MKKKYVIVFGNAAKNKNPAVCFRYLFQLITKQHALRHQSGTILMMKINELCFYLFQGRVFDPPQLEYVDFFTNTDDKFDQNKMVTLQESIEVTSTNLSEEEQNKSLPGIKRWLSRFYLKQQKLYQSDPNTFSRTILQQIKMVLLLEFKEMYWQIVIGNEFDQVTTFKENEKFIFLNVDFQTHKRFKKKVHFFQKKSDGVPFYKNLHKKKNWLIFLALIFSLLFGQLLCQGYKIDDYNVYDTETSTWRYHICSNKTWYFECIIGLFLTLIVIPLAFNFIQFLFNQQKGQRERKRSVEKRIADDKQQQKEVLRKQRQQRQQRQKFKNKKRR